MTARFAQLHFLTAYPANNMNRDDLSRPKNMVFGNASRLRLSSQCVKRAWRTSDVVQRAMSLHGDAGVRTQLQWVQLGQELVGLGHQLADVLAHVGAVKTAFEGEKKKVEEAAAAGDVLPGEAALDAAPVPAPEVVEKKSAARGGKKGKPPVVGLDTLKSAAIFFFSAHEIDFARQQALASLDPSGPTDGKPWPVTELQKQLKALTSTTMSMDVAMFGRMVAGNKPLEIEGAVQVAHPFTVNKSVVDDDFFVAVDDLMSADDHGSAHLSSNGFGSGLYYGYVNIDLELLKKNLGGDLAKARALLTALVEAVATVSPSGKQNSFASRSFASFLLVETGDGVPRSYADAFLTPVKEEPLIEKAGAALMQARQSIEKAFPSQQTSFVVMDRSHDQGSLDDVIAHFTTALS